MAGRVLLLPKPSTTRLPAITVSTCGASSSICWELGVIPSRLWVKVDDTTNTPPEALVP